ncbi:MAG: CoA-binding protein [Pseudomonadota bacterium]|nr:CoA-binding protein [Pseudomonadota bacterium]
MSKGMSGKTIFDELDPIFHPRSVAVLGASAKQGKIARVLMDRFLEMGFKPLYPVNPRESEIMGLRVFHNIKDVPGPVDLAIILTPTDAALAAVKDCVTKKVKTIVVTTSGFGEAGEQGRKVQQEMVRIARKGGARIIGPNCVGIYCPSSKLPFLCQAGKDSGIVGVVSQSGFFADFITQTACANNIKFSKAISCGNEADLNAVDFLEYLGEDPETELIAGYIEGVKDGRRFYELSREISKKKPIILWKGGLTEAGARAAVSHTGAIAGSRAVWEGALRQAGIVGARSFEEVFDYLYAFYSQPLPKGKRVGIISGPGSTAVGTTDICLELGLELPHFSKETVEKLRRIIPPVGGSVNNPIDLSLASLVNPLIHKDAIDAVARDKNIDMLLLITVIGGEQLREIVLDATRNVENKKPLVVTLMGGTTQEVAQDFPLMLGSGISVYPDAARAAKVLKKLWEYAEFRAGGSICI